MKRHIERVHFVGIGGIGMSGIAELLHNLGFHVQGSDLEENANVQRLRSLGIPVFVGHRSENIDKAQLLVVSSAVPKDNPELLAARACGIPVIPRAEMLAELMRMKYGIAVAGSHGKTTITSMIAHGMEEAGLDPTYVIGGRLIASGGNARLGESNYLVAEADESDGSFLMLHPTIAVISNIDPEHLDYYGDFSSLREAFLRFALQVPFYGRVVLHHEHPEVASLRECLDRPMITYGTTPQADLHLYERKPLGHQQQIRVAWRKSGRIEDFTLALPGRHNAENALACIAVLTELGIALDEIRRFLATFKGIQRRFHCTNLEAGVLVDDYAHHPNEIKATLETAVECWPERKICVFFQPHRYTRTRDLMHGFLSAFDLAHQVHILPIYSAGESAIEGIDAEKIVAGMQLRGHRCVAHCPDFDEVLRLAREELRQGSVVLLLGAGSVGRLAETLRQGGER